MKRVGLAIFKETFTQQIENQFRNEQIQIPLVQNEWDLQDLDYENQLKPFLPYIDQIDSEFMTIETYNHSFLKEISHINFFNLKKMFFAFSGLTNMEALAFIQAPNLEWIVLAQNLITVFKPAIKSVFPRLKNISLDENFIQQIDIGRLKVNKGGEDKYVGLTYVFRREMIPIINFYAKMENTKTMNSVSFSFFSNFSQYSTMQNSKTIKQRKVVQSVIKKFVVINEEIQEQLN